MVKTVRTIQKMSQPNPHLLLCAGTLPASWGSEGAFPALRYLGLQHSAISGELPLPAYYKSLLNEAWFSFDFNACLADGSECFCVFGLQLSHML